MINKNIISIIGKTNVGKSTLFNLLIKKKLSIIDNNINTTKNNNYGILNINNINYLLIDNCGFFILKKNYKNNLKKKIINQIIDNIINSYLILFVVDEYKNLSKIDKDICNILKKKKKKVYLIINKIDKFLLNIKYIYFNYYNLGFKKIFPISCTHNIGITKLINSIKKLNNEKFNILNNVKLIKISIIGDINTGKSTFINKFFNKKNISISSSIKGNTIDTLFFFYIKNTIKLILIDTPGIKKNFKFIKKNKLYLFNTLKIIKESDICILIIDINNFLNVNDLFLYNKIIKYKKGLIIIFNKCDLLKNNKIFLIKKLNNKNNLFLNYPIIYTSLKFFFNKKLKNKLINLINKIYYNKNYKFKTSLLNKKINIIFNKYDFLKKLNMKYCCQIKNELFPSFIFFIKKKKKFKKKIIKKIENIIIKELNLYGISINIKFKNN
ncbi:MAG: 50S ribosome-binding GTPase [Candidatus Shikimatogenerans sp. JK-2022]|nr:50S ribosome-binding GTPase [Candidatus Shikimatogenerans bostrichidophilus]